MNDGEVQPDDGLLDQIDWVSFFDSIPDNLNQLAESPLGDSVSIQEPPSALQISASTWINDIEQLLMADDDEESREEDRRGQCEEFFADIDFLVDGSADGSYEERVFKEGGSTPESNVSDDGREKEKSVGSEVKNGRDEADDDPISKKRRRQLRNRDAAVRSRERKKIYVRDLEMKSRYLEGECRRLERLLQCCIAENQTLHLYLQKDKGLGAPMTKLESAVLLLESLLLGSLLWFLGTMCLSSLPGQLQTIPSATALENVGIKDQEIVSLRRGARNEVLGLGALRLFFKSKRCKATRAKIKMNLPLLTVFV
ncbi:PREDICTED: bZIP transcription factor 60 [Nelumbo nucifera]|uniref:BZIP transcription factor 60 n=1 Tax=Nelumbo nucifera TaxID=4432 RepID=A0A1U8B4B6_NELNU|nr:PREDICTED: bZIP transcription factor 60 [Nelumbo nucifera]